LRQSWTSLDASRFPVFRIAENGGAQSAGDLVTLAARQTVRMSAGTVSDGLPMELADARPSGFLGRHFTAIHADLRLPARLADWSDHHILMAMSRRGEDLPGNLIVGDESFARWQALETPSHWFLESERFDRAGVRGRIAVSSLAGVHNDPADSWARAAVSLMDAGRLTPEDARRLRWLDAFGQVPPRTFALPRATSDTLDVWDDARMAARQFWGRASDDGRLSDDVRSFCAANAALLDRADASAD
jgi:hypothetical protein